MVTRDELHQMVDALRDDELAATARLLDIVQQSERDLLARHLAEAPLDDEPVTPEEEAGVAEARAQMVRGETISSDEVKRRLLP